VIGFDAEVIVIRGICPSARNTTPVEPLVNPMDAVGAGTPEKIVPPDNETVGVAV
jgi:hypothetical protein